MSYSRLLGGLPSICFTPENSGDWAGAGEDDSVNPWTGAPRPQLGHAGSLLGVPHVGQILPHLGQVPSLITEPQYGQWLPRSPSGAGWTAESVLAMSMSEASLGILPPEQRFKYCANLY
jgi:hypothetical protein